MKTLLSEKMMINGGAIDTTPIRFDYTGDFQEYVVPTGCKKLQVDCVGAYGGTVINGAGGKGGRVECILKTKSKQKLFIYIGKPQANSSTYSMNPSYNASDIRTDNSDLLSEESLKSRLIVAGGGGAGGYGQVGGAGGGLIGGIGSGGNTSWGGYGGTQTAGGAANTPSSSSIYKGSAGTFGLGGKGGVDPYNTTGGAGGAGWYGGGGGGNYRGGQPGGGGGGSSYTDPELCMDVVHTQGYSEAAGNGWIILTPIK